MNKEEYSHITEITTSIRERLASLEATVEEFGKRADRQSDSLRNVQKIQWAVVVAILTNAIIYMLKK